ncbi:MAG: hypothetical protein ACREJU_16750 [Nitrospiraceae bacterium]
MSSIPTPQLPLYRITLFYGPEAVADDPPRLSCIFNVKKRSWKGGIQIVVELDAAQVALITQRIDFEAWLTRRLSGLPDAEREDSESRARELLIQEVCSIKLSLALDADIRRENSRLEVFRYVEEVNRAVTAQSDRIKSNIVTELDLPPAQEGG